jgi:hypothetical protein
MSAKQQRNRHKRTGSTIELFQHSLNGYGYQSLSDDETKLFEYFYENDGDGHKEFCQIFGPEKIPENVGEFVGYFLIRKVMASPTFAGKAAKGN